MKHAEQNLGYGLTFHLFRFVFVRRLVVVVYGEIYCRQRTSDSNFQCLFNATPATPHPAFFKERMTKFTSQNMPYYMNMHVYNRATLCARILINAYIEGKV